MGRKLLMVLLGVGAVAGFASGFAARCHGGCGHHGAGFAGHWDQGGELSRRVADACSAAALRVYDQKQEQAPKP